MLCDDEKTEREQIQACLEKAAAGLFAGMEVRACPSGESLVKAVEDGARPALALLDIYMEGMDGMETARRLRGLLPGLPLAFLTTSREFAVDAFALEALHYLVKPVTAEKAKELLRRLDVLSEEPRRVLELSSGRGETVRFSLTEISRVESKNRGVALTLRDKRSLWLPCLFRKAEERLSGEPDFFQLGRGCIVNANDIQSLDYDLCVLKSGGSVPVSRRERAAVQSRYNNFLFCKMDRAKEAGNG